MQQVAAKIWNEIAPTARHPEWRLLFSLKRTELPSALDRIAARIREQGIVDPLVILAYLQLAPLLQERQAVQAWVAKHPNYRSALPELISTNEALMMAISEHRLKVSQTRELRKLLDGPPPTL